MQVRKVLPFISLTVILTACGGGSGGGTDNDARSSAVHRENSSSEVSSTRSNASSSSSRTGSSQESSLRFSSHSSASNGASSEPDTDIGGEQSSRASSSASASSNYPLPSRSSSQATSSGSSSNNEVSSTSSYSAPHSSASSESSGSSDSASSASSESSNNSSSNSSASSEPSNNGDSSSNANNESSNNSSSNFSASSESSSHSSSSIAADGKAPRATILFPSERSTTDKNEITIRGVAYDASGIDSVQVNGQPATLSDDTSTVAAQSVSAPEAFRSIQRLATTSSQTSTTSMGADASGQAWQVRLPLSAGANNITVEVTDKSGETDASADQASVNWQQIPTTFGFNPDTQTLYGFAPIDIVDFNLTSKQQRVYLERHYLPISGCLHIGSSSYYYLVSANEDQYGLYRLEINNDTGAEETFEGYFSRSKDYANFNTKLVCDSDGEALYFLVNQNHSGEGIDHSIIYRRSLAESSPWTPLYETDETSFVVSDLISGKDVLIGYSEASEKIISISKSDGSSKTLFDNYSEFSVNLTQGSTKELVYLTTLDGIDRIDIFEQSVKTIGGVDPDSSLSFSQPRSTHLDPINQRFLVGDSDYHSIISIDQHTGERSIALSNEMGTGPKIVAIRDIVLNESETYAYVIDDGGNAAEKVVEIDLTTGNRRRIGEIYSEVNGSAAGLELDESNKALYVATGDTVYRIDLSTNATTTLALSDTNQGAVFSSISSIAFDHENETLFISDAVQGQIVALNVNTLETTLVSSEFKGEGQVFSGINGLVFDPDTKFLYASNQGHGNVHKVDTETGNRTEIATACAPSSSSGEPADMIMELSFDSELNELLLVGFRVSRINLNTSTCNYDTYDHLLSSVEPLSGNRLLAGTSGALKLIDEETGEVVVISQ